MSAGGSSLCPPTTGTRRFFAITPRWRGIEEAVIETLRDPDLRNRDKTHGDREVFYRSGMFAPPYHEDLLKVVVAYHQYDDGTLQGRIVTAQAIDSVARGEKRLWTRPQNE
jgi:hypothetical protein